MDNQDKDSIGDTDGQGVSEPSEGTAQGSTPQGGGGHKGDGGKNGGRDSSQPGGQND
jgi:hypothetical protein